MAKAKIQVAIRFAWWLRFYLWGVGITARLSGLEPDWTKVCDKVSRSIRIKVG